MYHRFYYDAGTGGGAAAPLPPALKDMSPKPGAPVFPINPVLPEPIKDGDGKDKLPDINDKDKLPAPDPNKTKDPAPEGKKYDDKGVLVDDPEYKAPDADPNTDEPDDSNYWEEVEKHTGIPVKVEYPADMDILSPQAVAMREMAVRDQTRIQFEQSIKDKYPHAFAFMLHHMAGGSDADFFKPERGISLPDIATLDSSVDAQTAFVKADLLAKGVDPEVIEAQIAADIKNNKLKGKATALHTQKVAERADELREIEGRNAADNKKTDLAISAMVQRIEKTIPDLGFVIPEADKTKLGEYFQDNLIYDRPTGKFYLNKEVSGDDLKSVLEGLTFLYYGGNLDKVLQKKAASVAAQRLRKQADKSKDTRPSGQDGGKSGDGFVPFGQMGPKKS